MEIGGIMLDGLDAHPLRPRVLAEVHARPFSPMDTPQRVLHYAFMTDEEGAAAARASLEQRCAELGLPGPAPGAKHHRVRFSGVLLRWESHSEFTTYSWEFASGPGGFEATPSALTEPMRALPQPGPLIVAVDLHLLPAGALQTDIEVIFGPNAAVAEAEGGDALIATDFQPNAQGFVRIAVVDRALSPPRAGSLVQRVLEIETYRTLALLGLPEAQALGPSIRRIESELPTLLEAMQTSEGLDANQRLLARLTTLAADLETGAAGSLFRFGATRAYEELVRLRLEAIGEQPVPGVSSWSAFLARRINPAIRTCMSTEERQANLSRKLARAAQLLRTRVDIELEHQNRDLLTAMNERARLQLRLQQTVEGLSVAAISYYVASLVHLLLEGAHHAGLPVDPAVGTAVAVPLVLLAVWYTVRRIRRAHLDHE